MDELITVIIPVYGVEPYLRQCVDSVLNQTHKNLEVILIDDESPDKCGEICDEYEKKDSRVTVIHQKNGGAAAARNTGLLRASGEYLAFVDSDDYLPENAYETLLSYLHKYGADAAEAGFTLVYKDETQTCDVTDDIKCYNTADYLKRYTTEYACAIICNKLFKRRIFSGIFYETGHKIDDEFFTYQGIMNAEKIVSTTENVYFYRMRRSSVMHDATAEEKKLYDRLEFMTARRAKITEKFPELKQHFDSAYLDAMLYYSRDAYASEDVIRRTQTLVKDYFKNEACCSLPLSFRFELMRFIHSKPASLLGKRRQMQSEDKNNMFD